LEAKTMSRIVPAIAALLLAALAMGCATADEKPATKSRQRPTNAAHREQARPESETETAARKLLVEIRKEREGTSHAAATTTSGDPHPSDAGVPQPTTGKAAGAAEADRLMRQGQRVGMKAKKDSDLKNGRRSVALFRKATTVAPDYRPAWEKYLRTLKNVKKRFGHSVMMGDGQINREISRCRKALARLP
jgi:hypothetical protein